MKGLSLSAQHPNQERIILGIDPGTNMLGYGVLKTTVKEVKVEAMGVIDMRKCKDVYLKLGRVFERVMGIIDSFLPDELAIESAFFGKNVQSMLKLGRAQGVAIAAAISREIPIHEYAPKEIKLALTGNGAAAKEQVAVMLQRVLHIPDKSMLPYLDASDALAVAYCHYLHSSGFHMPSTLKSTSSLSRNKVSWEDFVKQNGNRVHSKRKTSTSNI